MNEVMPDTNPPMDAAAPSWQHGYPIEKLRETASIFKAAHKHLVFGAFGLTKERDIAEALQSNSLLLTRGQTGAPIAVAIGKQLKNAGHITDVAKREFEIPPGSLRVSAFAAIDSDAGAKVLAHLAAKFPGNMWLEIFEEDMISKHAVAHITGLEYVATKIAAGSEIKGIYTNSKPGVLPLHSSEEVSLAVLEKDFITEEVRQAMLAEVNTYAEAAEGWKQHYSSYNKRKSWTAFALRGYLPSDPGFIIKPQEMAKEWKKENPNLLDASSQWTVAAARFPVTMGVVERILAGAEPDRVRLMRLAAGGELSRHADVTDRSAGVANGALARLHLPIQTSDKVIMHGWDKRGRHMQTNFPARSLCYLDQRGPHRVENLDKVTERIHLVIDMHSNQRVRDMIGAAI